MKKYKVPCEWKMYGTMEVEASCLKEAIEKAYDEPLPDGDICDDTFHIDQVEAEQMNRVTFGSLKTGDKFMVENSVIVHMKVTHLQDNNWAVRLTNGHVVYMYDNILVTPV